MAALQRLFDDCIKIGHRDLNNFPGGRQVALSAGCGMGSVEGIAKKG